MGKVRFGVIGLKGIGRNHIRAITSIENAELAAVADINEEVGKAVSSEYDVEWYRDYVKMLEEASIDAVSICTPHYLHHPMAMKSLEYGKHVLLEKPMAITAREADEIVEESKSRGLKVGVVFQLRLNPTSQKTKKIITEELGQIYRVCMEACFFRTQSYYNSDPWRGRWATEGGGVLINQGVHHLDLLQWLVGKPVRLHGQVGTLLHNIEVEDIAEATILFENGAHGVVQLGTIDAPPTVRLEVLGDKGKITIEGNRIRRFTPEKPIKDYVSEGEAWGSPKVECEEIVVEGRGAGHKAIIEDFARAVSEDREPMVPGEEGRVSIEIVNAIILSSFLGKAVDFPIDRDEYDRLMERLRQGR